MNEVWKLTNIYNGFDDPVFSQELEQLKKTIAQCDAYMAKLGSVEPLTGLREGIRLLEEINELAGKLITYTMLRQSADTRDGEAASRLGQVMAAISDTAASEAAFKDWAAKVPDLMTLVENDPELKDYTFLFTKIQDSSRNAWGVLQEYLICTVPMTYRG